METLEKVSNIIKSKFDSELMYNKKYLKLDTKVRTKGGFQCLYPPAKLID